MYRAASLFSTVVYFLCSPRLLSASPITPDDTLHNLYPFNPSSTTNLTIPTTTTTNLTALHAVHCFPARERPRLHPIPTHCSVAIAGGVLFPHPPIQVTKFYDWSFRPGSADFVLPNDGFWRHQTCAVAVRNPDHNIVGSFSLDEVGITAAEIARQCVGDIDGMPPLKGKDKGGWSQVGSTSKGFYVSVYGVPSSAEDGNGNATAQAGTVGGTVQRVPIPGDGEVQVTR